MRKVGVEWDGVEEGLIRPDPTAIRRTTEGVQYILGHARIHNDNLGSFELLRSLQRRHD